MNQEAQTTEIAKSTEIAKILGNGLEKTKSDYILQKFQDFTQVAEEWKNKATQIVVTDESQTDIMKEAREGRLLLKNKRIEIEKTRKALKDQSLQEGRIIDGIAKYLTGLVEPAEKHLELQEKFVELKQQKERQELKEKRIALLMPYKEIVDPYSIQLDLITEEAFNTILNGTITSYENKKAEALRLENERKEKERKDKLFSQRKIEMARYITFLQKDDITLNNDTTDEEYQSLLENLKKRNDDYALEQQKIIEENKKLKNQVKETKKEVLNLKTIVKKSVQTPIIEQTQNNLPENFNCFTQQDSEVVSIKNDNFISKDVYTENLGKEVVSKEEYDKLNKKFEISKKVLLEVLMYIVPDNLRLSAEKALKEISELDYAPIHIKTNEGAENPIYHVYTQVFETTDGCKLNFSHMKRNEHGALEYFYKLI